MVNENYLFINFVEGCNIIYKILILVCCCKILGLRLYNLLIKVVLNVLGFFIFL